MLDGAPISGARGEPGSATGWTGPTPPRWSGGEPDGDARQLDRATEALVAGADGAPAERYRRRRDPIGMVPGA